MFEWLKDKLGRREPVQPTPSRAQASSRWDPPVRVGPPPPPPPPPPPRVAPSEPEPITESKGPRVRVILDDGTLAPIEDDPDIREQMERLASQILPSGDER